MKKIIIYSILGIIGLAMLPGCKKLDEVNTNPNQPLAVTPNVQLTATELQIGYTIGGDMSRFEGLMDQDLVASPSARQFSTYSQYIFQNADFDQVWQNMYLSMNNLQDLYKTSSKANNYYYAGIAQVLEAYTLGMSTDVFNDMPYSQAFQGFSNLQPTFDKQQALYNNIQTLLANGITLLSKPSGGTLVPGADDIIYGGNAASWVKLAYALEARFYLHIRKVDNTALAKAQAALANGFTSSADDAYFKFSTSNKGAGPWYQFQQQRAGEFSFIQATAGQTLINTGDPRLASYIDTAQDGLGTFYQNPQSGVQIMTYAEQLFIAAEIAFLNNDKAGAATNSNNGAIESVTAITGAAPSGTWATTYTTETAGTITLEKIMNQKYLALYLNPESFSDWRRTGFPTLVAYPGNVTNGVIPRRFLYSETETERNTHTAAEGNIQITGKVWWDN